MIISVIGAGAMGVALALSFDRSGNDVTVCATEFDDRFVNSIETNRRHPSLDVPIPESIDFVRSHEWESVLQHTEIAVLAVASDGIRSVLRQASGSLGTRAVWLVASKGWDPMSLEPLSEVISKESPHRPTVHLVGPALAGEVAIGVPTAVVCASLDRDAANHVAQALRSENLAVFVTDDVVGVEVGAALKNVLAVAIGLCDGVGDAKGVSMTNAKSAFFSEGLVEMTNFGRALGGRDETILGLAGAGDLFATVVGGRNGRFGRLVGSGKDPKEALAEIKATVEGFGNAAKAVQLSKRLNLELPLVNMVHSVLYEGVAPEAALSSFFGSWTHQSTT